MSHFHNNFVQPSIFDKFNNMNNMFAITLNHEVNNDGADGDSSNDERSILII